MNIITGNIKPSDGQVLWDGHDIKILGSKYRSIIGYAPQQQGLYDTFTGRRFLSYMAALKGIPKKDMSREIDRVLEYVNMTEAADRAIGTYSGGMKQRILIAQAVLGKPKLIVLDEPTVGLDIVARDEVLTMLREYMEKNENSAILISSHISSDLENLCDDLYMIHNGKIILHEDTDVLLADYAVLKVSEDAYGKIERQYILKTKNEPYGYSCLTNQKQFYLENYPNIAVENGRIDDLIVMMED